MSTKNSTPGALTTRTARGRCLRYEGTGKTKAKERKERQNRRDSKSDVALQQQKETKKNLKNSTWTVHALSCLPSLFLCLFQHRKTLNSHQGGIDHLENPLAAAARELREETGIVSARVVAISSRWLEYDSPTRVADPTRPGQPGAVLSYRGQTQKWVLMYYYGEEGGGEVDLGPEATREFSEWGWRVS